MRPALVYFASTGAQMKEANEKVAPTWPPILSIVFPLSILSLIWLESLCSLIFWSGNNQAGSDNLNEWCSSTVWAANNNDLLLSQIIIAQELQLDFGSNNANNIQTSILRGGK